MPLGLGVCLSSHEKAKKTIEKYGRKKIEGRAKIIHWFIFYSFSSSHFLNNISLLLFIVNERLWCPHNDGHRSELKTQLTPLVLATPLTSIILGDIETLKPFRPNLKKYKNSLGLEKIQFFIDVISEQPLTL